MFVRRVSETDRLVEMPRYFQPGATAYTDSHSLLHLRLLEQPLNHRR